MLKHGDMVRVIAKLPHGFAVGTVGEIHSMCSCDAAEASIRIARVVMFAVIADCEIRCLPEWALRKIDPDDDTNKVTTWDQVPFNKQITKRKEEETV